MRKSAIAETILNLKILFGFTVRRFLSCEKKMNNSLQLLRDYSANGNETAFHQLVEGHINLVYSAALRRVNGDAHLAQDVTQTVFTDLVRKSRRIGDDVILSSWLYQHTCFTAANLLRSEHRRKIREEQAVEMSSLNDASDAAWQQLAPVLEEAMQSLSERDRSAIVLRYFEQQPLREVGTALKITEDAARMRVDRALGKLRASLIKRGVTMSVVAVSAVISAHAVSAAPMGTAAQVSAAALAGSAASGGGGFLKLFASTKAKVAAGVAVVGVTTYCLLPTEKPATLNSTVAKQIIQGMFARVSAPLPAQMRFVADLEITRKPWTKSEIEAEVKRQEKDDMKEEDIRKFNRRMQEQHRKEAEELRRVRLEDLAAAYGEKRSYLHQEWFSKGLWRLDSTETTPRSDFLKSHDQPLLAGVQYESTRIEIGDPAFTNIASYFVENRMRTVWIRNPPGDHWLRDRFWRAHTIEQEVAFVLTMAAADMTAFAIQAKTKPKWERDIDSFSGLQMNTNRLDELVSGSDGRFTVTTEEKTLNGRKMSVLRLQGHAISLGHGMDVTVFADAAHLTNIYRIELNSMPFFKTPYISSRDDFDTNGFPHLWTIETPDPDELKKVIRFKEVEFGAKFDDRTVFTPTIPTGYSMNRYPQ
jgi:RNA polymerase sigma factor (sigma-70 family)